MQTFHHLDLTDKNTLAVPAIARELVLIESPDEWQIAQKGDFILSGGSNVIFCEEVKRRLLQPVFKGRQVIGETRDHVYLKVQAGENWHETVQFIVEQGWYGAENLALIPGLAGAAPVQNIGAYGVEIKDILASVEVYDWQNKQFKNLSAKSCGFAYRTSHFKNIWRDRYIITAITLELSKKANLNIHYPGLQEQAAALTSPLAVMQAVTAMRKKKLPDVTREPNAGSFFHNPITEWAHLGVLKMKFPTIPWFVYQLPAKNNRKMVKIPAGWCIEQCGFKGVQIGAVSVSAKHALVLINHGGTGKDILTFAREIQRAVWKKFSLSLQIEPTIVDESF